MNESIFSRTFEQIQSAQQKGPLDEPITKTKDNGPYSSQSDLDKLAAVGVAGLREAGLFGIIDRLQRDGVIDGIMIRYPNIRNSEDTAKLILSVYKRSKDRYDFLENLREYKYLYESGIDSHTLFELCYFANNAPFME